MCMNTDRPTQPLDDRAADLYAMLDGLHGQVLRAKYRLTEDPDADVLAILVADIVALAGRVENEWQAYEARGNA